MDHDNESIKNKISIEKMNIKEKTSFVQHGKSIIHDLELQIFKAINEQKNLQERNLKLQERFEFLSNDQIKNMEEMEENMNDFDKKFQSASEQLDQNIKKEQKLKKYLKELE